MPTTCAVVGCYNRHSKESKYSFYRFPTDPDRRHRWVSFVSRQNTDGSPWKPGEGDRVCSEHFISKKKSDLPGCPDYVPSVYPEVTAKKKCISGNSNFNTYADSLARYERVQRRAAANEKERIQKEREEERICLFVQQAIRSFEHDHGGYCKSGGAPCETDKLVSLQSSCQMQASLLSEGSQSSNIPAEIGRFYAITFTTMQ